eukprot:TRINITY_DN409_c0_g1_i1.p1 TRINITY_DN409_c0_g1~~TRINITY_DN409_c0_g1_i1.p1  ORF type:complete len:144 (+),score=45.79 TRINITY_DN409_c0_g1_i1:56-433(+)
MSGQKITEAELSLHNKKTDVWMAINGNVYDVTKFLNEHPGGEEVLLEVAGKDASTNFEDIGHSDDAREMLKTYLVGPYEKVPAPKAEKKAPAHTSAPQPASSQITLLVPVALAAVAVLYYLFVAA